MMAKLVKVYKVDQFFLHNIESKINIMIYETIS